MSREDSHWFNESVTASRTTPIILPLSGRRFTFGRHEGRLVERVLFCQPGCPAWVLGQPNLQASLVAYSIRSKSRASGQAQRSSGGGGQPERHTRMEWRFITNVIWLGSVRPCQSPAHVGH